MVLAKVRNKTADLLVLSIRGASCSVHSPMASTTSSLQPTLQVPRKMPILSKVITFNVPTNRAAAIKAARVIRSIKSRYRTQAFLFLAYHFFLTSPMHLDIFIMFFILVSNFMNRQHAFPSQLAIDGLRFLLDERRFIMP